MGAWGARELMGDIVVGQTGDDLIQYGRRACVAAGFVLPCPQCVRVCVILQAFRQSDPSTQPTDAPYRNMKLVHAVVSCNTVFQHFGNESAAV